MLVLFTVLVAPNIEKEIYSAPCLGQSSFFDISPLSYCHLLAINKAI